MLYVNGNLELSAAKKLGDGKYLGVEIRKLLLNRIRYLFNASFKEQCDCLTKSNFKRFLPPGATIRVLTEVVANGHS